MAAHPVKLVDVDGVLAQDNQRHLEWTRDQAAPDRQDKELRRPRPTGQTWFG